MCAVNALPGFFRGGADPFLPQEVIAQFAGAPIRPEPDNERVPRRSIASTNAFSPTTKVKSHNHECGNLNQRNHLPSSGRTTGGLSLKAAPACSNCSTT